MKIERTNSTGVPSRVSCSAARRAALATRSAASTSVLERYCSATNSRMLRNLRATRRERNNGDAESLELRGERRYTVPGTRAVAARPCPDTKSSSASRALRHRFARRSARPRPSRQHAASNRSSKRSKSPTASGNSAAEGSCF